MDILMASTTERSEKKAKLTSSHESLTEQNNTSHKNNNRKRNKSRWQTDNPDVQLSKSLSWLLRHTAPSLGLHPTSDGYIPVNDILSLNHPRFQNGKVAKYTVEDVRRVVENNDKQRFRLEYKDLSSHDLQIEQPTSRQPEQQASKVLCIRAHQGHSYKDVIECDKLLTALSNEELSDPNLTIVHGTTRKAWEDHIRIEGLSRMKRNHIHFATGLPQDITTDDSQKNTAPISGMRSTSQIYVYINGKKCAEDGIKFFRSDNGVILTAGENEGGLLPVKYFKTVVLASNGKILLNDED
jgi:2'-phosphotransferase